jgi:thiol-disulfide isomerase/thioredoxin
MSPKWSVDWLWLPMVALFLVPVAVHLSTHPSVESPVVQGSLITGRDGLDSLLAEAAGSRPVIVNFWATWCTPCVSELPHIDRVFASLDGAVLAIAVDIGDPDLGKLLDFRETVTLSLPVVWLDGREANLLKEEWGLPDVIPVTVFLDAAGTETARALGSRSEDFFRDAVLGMQPPDTVSSFSGSDGLHIVVAGDPSDSLTAALLGAAVELAGEEGVDSFDPSIPADREELESRYLPIEGVPYAQPCVGTSCGRLSRTVEDLIATVNTLTP